MDMMVFQCYSTAWRGQRSTAVSAGQLACEGSWPQDEMDEQGQCYSTVWRGQRNTTASAEQLACEGSWPQDETDE